MDERLDRWVRTHGPVTGPLLHTLLRVTAETPGVGPHQVFLRGDRVSVAPVDPQQSTQDILAWADTIRFAATGDGAAPLTPELADLLIDCACEPAERRPSPPELRNRVELVCLGRSANRPRRSWWAELSRQMRLARRGSADAPTPALHGYGFGRRIPRALVRAYDELLGTAPILEQHYQFAAHDDLCALPGRRQRGDRVRWLRPHIPTTTPGEQLTLRVRVHNHGRIDWRDRFLRRTGPIHGPHTMDGPELLAMPDIPAGDTAEIPIPLRVPSAPGLFAQRFTIVDERGHSCFPAPPANLILHIRALR